jgi:GNAT superfamily N-acetyltransferase
MVEDTIPPPARPRFPIEFQEFERINNTPAIALIARAWSELLEAGLAAPELVGHWQQKAIVGNFDGEAIALITWEPVEYKNCIWLQMGYVDPSYRRRGIYVQMWERLVAKARELKIPQIESGIHVRNEAALALSDSLGRERIAIMTRYRVPEAIHG